MQTEKSRKEQATLYSNSLNKTCNDVDSDSPKKFHQVLTKINSNQTQLNNLLYKLSKPKNITVNHINQLNKIYKKNLSESKKQTLEQDSDITYVMKQLKTKRRSLKLPMVDSNESPKFKIMEELKSNIKPEDFNKKKQIVFTKAEIATTEILTQKPPQQFSKASVIQNLKKFKSKINSNNFSNPVNKYISTPTFSDANLQNSNIENYQSFRNNNNVSMISYESTQDHPPIPDYPKKQYLKNVLERIQEKQEERLIQTSNNKNRTKTKSQLNPIPLLTDINYQQIQNYIQNNKELSINFSVDEIYDYFLDMTKTIKIIFENPLIKKYKNCVYFGDNFSQNINTCHGFLFHYNEKIYYGEFKNGKRHGKGCEINFKQNIISRGQFDSGYKRGPFHIIKKNDYQYIGQITDGLFQGNGILITNESKYEGQFVRGFKQGKGKQFFYKTEQTYTGTYFEGKFQNQGQLVSKNYFYEGNFTDGLQDGQGYQKTPLEQYKGQFIQGKREGNGVMYLNNGDTYIGQFKSGNMHGKGQLKMANGKILNGNFNCGILQQLKQGSRHSTTNNNITNLSMNSSLLKKSRDLKSILQDQQQMNSNRKLVPIGEIKNDNGIVSSRINRNSKINPENYVSKQKIIRNIKNEDVRISNSFNPDWETTGEFNQRSRYNSTEKNQLILNASIDFQNLFNSNFTNNKQRQKIPLKFDYSMLQSSVEDEIPSFPVIQKGLQKRFSNKH